MDGNGPSSPISGRRVSSTDLETIPPVRRGIAAASLVGPAQVGARIVEFRLLRSFHPISSARLASALHPIGAAFLVALGAPGIIAFAGIVNLADPGRLFAAPLG
jgi:hypothetical protein